MRAFRSGDREATPELARPMLRIAESMQSKGNEDQTGNNIIIYIYIAPHWYFSLTSELV
jgi:hypothetical protein